MTSRGVSLEVLCCPTCGDPFRWTLRWDEPDESFTADLAYTTKEPSPPPYLVCWQGHAWTIKTLFRSDDAPDAVLLDRYIGERGQP